MSDPIAAPEPTFARDPLGYFDAILPTVGDVYRPADHIVGIAEPTAAKAVLANPDGLFREHSDFFHTKRGAFGPRETQIAIGRGARQLLSDVLAKRQDRWPETIDRVLGTTSEWPHAGNRLFFEHLAPVLLTPEAHPRLGKTIDGILENGVLAGARERRSKVVRAFFRWRVFRQLTREIERRAKEDATDPPRDLFDVLARAHVDGARANDLGELYLPLFFAITGSVGFALGWSLHLLGTQPKRDIASSWVVREALRLWPIAWQLARFPATAHRIHGVEVTPDTHVLVSPYVIQRHPSYWDAPDEFRPERWAEQRDHQAYLPFGWGTHTCVAWALSLHLVQDVLDTLDGRFTVTPHTARPFIGPSLAPPPFTLRRL
ncbi:MAG: cytochrome P450 [Acidobacteriota bacterium]